jgi:hypothetical protein
MKTTTDMVVDEAELAPLEEHLLCCPTCVKRAEEAADFRKGAVPTERRQGDLTGKLVNGSHF